MDTKENSPAIIWFKRDLRVHDHMPLYLGSKFDQIIPLYIIEPDYWKLPDTSGRQWLFIKDSLEDLNDKLTALGAPLVIYKGKAEEILEKLILETEARSIISHQETGNFWTYQRDLRIKSLVKKFNCDWKEYAQFGVKRGLINRDGWAKKWDHFMSAEPVPTPSSLVPYFKNPTLNIPTQEELGLKDVCPGRQRGGHREAIKTLNSFLDERGKNYQKGMSSPITAQWECSRMSTFLSSGTISMRETAQSVWLRQRELKHMASEGQPVGSWRGSMSSFNGRLHWHCHFIQKLEDTPRHQLEAIHPFYNDLRDDPFNNPEARIRLKAWSEGKTGFPFVDACMRSLNSTGWINFRMRAMLMAFSSYHLWLDWRVAGSVLAKKFTDYEPGIHWQQVQMQSGTTGINTLRVYNPVKQGYDQDPTNAFTREWLSELVDIPDSFIQEPWKWPDYEQNTSHEYPHRIVDHLEAAKKAKAQIYAIRKKQGHREIAKNIYDKHGSRRSQNSRTKIRH